MPRYEVRYSLKFKKDYKRMKSQGKDLSKLDEVIDRLCAGVSLDAKHRDHQLKGAYYGHRECHIESDWLLIYLPPEHGEIILTAVRTGSHSDLLR
ncbi:MAG: type II toxin-antitoxin system YafQ family toxin [Coriobacteriales bacterium]|nr:type II toxin-antitoxin system YafQ family toxin [Coriobacteriales bacterium]